MSSGRPNLFRHATRELHQDAVLAWLVEWSSPRYAHADPGLHRAAATVLHSIVRKHPDCLDARVADIICVRTQWKGIDVLARVSFQDDRPAVLLIENKTTSTRHHEQLTRYCKIARQEFPKDQFVGLYVKTGWIRPSDRDLPDGYVLIDRAALLEGLQAIECRHAIFRDYVDYLVELDQRYRDQIEALDDPARLPWALGHDHVQWRLIERIFDRIGGGQYCGVNRDGTPWTQYCFRGCDSTLATEDRLFWRLDKRKPRRREEALPYLALRAYQVFDKKQSGLRQAKLQRLARYKELFQYAVQTARRQGMPLEPGKPVADRSGKYESEIGVFFIDEQNPINEIVRWIPVLHNAFVEVLDATSGTTED